MFRKLFKRKTNRLPPVNKWYVFLNEIIKTRAKKAAHSLSRKTNRLSSKQLIFYLYTFSAIGILLNVMIIVSAFKARSTSIHTMIHKTPGKNFVTAFVLPIPKSSAKDYQRVLQIEAFLDSLQGSETGKRQYDSFIQRRPHFRDSIAQYKDLFKNR